MVANDNGLSFFEPIPVNPEWLVAVGEVCRRLVELFSPSGVVAVNGTHINIIYILKY